MTSDDEHLFMYRHTLFYCASLNCSFSDIAFFFFLQFESLWIQTSQLAPFFQQHFLTVFLFHIFLSLTVRQTFSLPLYLL